MSDEERTHAQLIEEIIGRKLKPFIVLASVLISIFGIIAVPIAAQVLKLTEDQSNIESKISDKVDSEEAYRNFLLKGAYHILQKDEHIADIDAIRNPLESDIIYMKLSSREAERLDIAQRGSKDEYYKKAYDKSKNETN